MSQSSIAKVGERDMLNNNCFHKAILFLQLCFNKQGNGYVIIIL